MLRSLIVVVGLLVSGLAHAEPIAFSGSIGLGLLVGPLAWDGPGALGGGEVHQRSTVAGVNLAGGIFVGGGVATGVVIGLAIDANLFAGGHAGTLGYTRFSNGGQFDGMVRVVLHPQDLVVRLGAGASVASLGGSRLDVGANDNVADFERLLGPVVSGSVGLGGAALELRAAYLLGPHTTYVPIVLTLRGHFGRD